MTGEPGDAGMVRSDPVAVGPGDATAHPMDAEPAPVNGAAPTPTDGGSVADAQPAMDEGVAAEESASDPGVPADPAAAALGDPAADAATALDPADASLLALVDRLAQVLERSDLGELEVTSGSTTIVLRAPSAIERPAAVASAPEPAGAPATSGEGAPASVTGAAAPAPAARPSVKAPLTGIYYSAPSPGATPYVKVGDQVAAGQLIGLIEAMKLFNEIKSDLAGRVVRVCVDNGALVKAKQPLIEVEPL